VIGLVNLNWDFSGPVRIGDTIRAHVEVADLRPTSKPGRSLATLAFAVINQSGETVQRGRMLVVVHAD
jgi:acyl dehydratase